MPKQKICFEQVPLRVVEKLLEGQAQLKKGRPGAWNQEQELGRTASHSGAGGSRVRSLCVHFTVFPVLYQRR